MDKRSPSASGISPKGRKESLLGSPWQSLYRFFFGKGSCASSPLQRGWHHGACGMMTGDFFPKAGFRSKKADSFSSVKQEEDFSLTSIDTMEAACIYGGHSSETPAEPDIRSDEVQEILTAVPSWMIRYGITLIFVLILVLIFLSWLIRYPDTIQGNVIITTENPTVALVTQNNGYITELQIADSSYVRTGQTVAVVTNSSSQQDILLLTDFISECEYVLSGADSKIFKKPFPTAPDSLVLGQSQSEYNRLVSAMTELWELHTDKYHVNEIALIDRQIGYNKEMAAISKDQLTLMHNVVENSKNRFEADSLLHVQGVIAKHEFYERRSTYISKQQELAQLQKSQLQYRIVVADLQKKRQDMTKVFEAKDRSLRAGIEENIKMLRTDISSWKQNYVLISPIDGTLIYHGMVRQNRYINVETPLFFVVPNDGGLRGEMCVSENGFGKVKVGQEVRIRLANFPYQQYGQLLGKVEQVSLMASEEQNGQPSSGRYYSVAVSLSEKLTTTHAKEIPFTPNMAGTANIVTEDLRLIDRVFNTFREVLEK